MSTCPDSVIEISGCTPSPIAIDSPVLLLNDLTSLLNRFVVLPKHAAEALALWIVHTYAFQLRDVSTYIGVESPEPRCGKTTLLTVLAEICHRALPASNISPPAFFRVPSQRFYRSSLLPQPLIDFGFPEVGRFWTWNRRHPPYRPATLSINLALRNRHAHVMVTSCLGRKL